MRRTPIILLLMLLTLAPVSFASGAMAIQNEISPAQVSSSVPDVVYGPNSPNSDQKSINATMPLLVDGFDKPVPTPKVDEQLMVSVNVTNNDSRDWPSVIVVMIQDSQGVTRLLTWHSQTVSAGQTVGSGMSWMPDQAGSYKIQTFAVSSLTMPVIFSAPPPTEVNIGTA